MAKVRFVLLTLLVTACSPSPDPGGWAPAGGLKTRWAADLDPASPLPEYPRPQMVRSDWTNLNGLWELAVFPADSGAPSKYPDRILVPFPVESALSGVARSVGPEDRIWYRREFSLPDLPTSIPEEARSRPGAQTPYRWLLHFGAVDWEAEVFLNGTSLGTHRGGYDPFTFDITDALTGGGAQKLVVAVRDPTDEGDQPRGKQVLDPHGIWYMSVSGIWQTVWLEPVPQIHIAEFEVTPNLPNQRVEVRLRVEGSSDLVPVSVAVLADGEVIAEATGTSDIPVSLPVADPRPWSPADPFLYGLSIRLGAGEIAVGEGPGDLVESYFGMRSIAVGPDESGLQRLLLNGEPLFQYGLLDQGWWPDGLYTAPTDEALRSDVERTKGLGFNLIRKHVKVEPARWYYHCDREGILVWQDMPSGNNETVPAQEEFAAELEAVVSSLRNHPSIVMWVPFNEGWGQHDTEKYVEWLKGFDPTRLVNNASGWTDMGVGDVLDIHRYPGPGAPTPDALGGSRPTTSRPRAAVTPRAAVLGEFGGLGLPLAGHTWVNEDNWGYRSYESVQALNLAYADLLTQLRPLIGEGLAAAVYTQTTDVEVEVNGIMTYDREVVKLDEGAPALHRGLFAPPPILKPIASTSMAEGQLWHFAFSDPGEGWADPGFDDSRWKEGPGGFGTQGTPGAVVRTVWDTPEIWIRRSFSLDADTYRELDPSRLYLRIHHDEDAEVYLNGTLIANLEGYTSGYQLIPLGSDAGALLAEGENSLAAHVRQTDGGQYVDLGIVEWVEMPGG